MEGFIASFSSPDAGGFFGSSLGRSSGPGGTALTNATSGGGPPPPPRCPPRALLARSALSAAVICAAAASRVRASTSWRAGGSPEKEAPAPNDGEWPKRVGAAPAFREEEEEGSALVPPLP